MKGSMCRLLAVARLVAALAFLGAGAVPLTVAACGSRGAQTLLPLPAAAARPSASPSAPATPANPKQGARRVGAHRPPGARHLRRRRQARPDQVAGTPAIDPKQRKGDLAAVPRGNGYGCGRKAICAPGPWRTKALSVVIYRLTTV